MDAIEDEPSEFDETPEQEPEELEGLFEYKDTIKNLTDPVKVEKDSSLDIDEVS